MDDIAQKLNQKIDAFGFYGINVDKTFELQEIINLRNSKTSWIGKAENDLRFKVDEFLRKIYQIQALNCHCSDGPFHYEICPFYNEDHNNMFAKLGEQWSKGINQ